MHITTLIFLFILIHFVLLDFVYKIIKFFQFLDKNQQINTIYREKLVYIILICFLKTKFVIIKLHLKSKYS